MKLSLEYKSIFIFLLLVNTIKAQTADSIAAQLEQAYQDTNYQLLESILENWADCSIKNTDTISDDTLKAVYEIYKTVFEAPEYFQWSIQNKGNQDYHKAPYYLVLPRIYYSINRLTIKGDEKQEWLDSKVIIDGRFLIREPLWLKRKVKVKNFKRFS